MKKRICSPFANTFTLNPDNRSLISVASQLIFVVYLVKLIFVMVVSTGTVSELFFS